MILSARNLFDVIIKIFGLFFLREIANSIPQVFSTFITYFNKAEFETSIGIFIFSLIVLFFYVILSFQLIFRTNKIIDFLKLDHFSDEHRLSLEEDTPKNISLSKTEILTISLILIGGFILVEEIPNLCQRLYLLFIESKSTYKSNNDWFFTIIQPLIKVLIGLLILGEKKQIIRFIEGNQKEENVDTE